MKPGRKCTICNHPQREVIDREIVGLGAPIRRIAKHFDVCESSVRRHIQAHVAADLTRALANTDDPDADRIGDLRRYFEGSLERLSDLDEQAAEAIEAARKSENWALVLNGVRERGRLEGRRHAARELLAKGAGELLQPPGSGGSEITINILAAPEYRAEPTHILEAEVIEPDD